MFSGRTTIHGEGLQHQDGHSVLAASAVPACRSYDPTFAYELAVILHDGLRRMYVDAEDVFYYLTLTNQTYLHRFVAIVAFTMSFADAQRVLDGRNG